MSAAIRVSDLTKIYRLGKRRGRDYRTLRESISEAARATWRRLARRSGSGVGRAGDSPGTFRALDRVSFDVEPGEVLGIIGRNGAGKSTLLKILSRITEPTGGRVAIRGRVGSLLEVGTGFHSELTGRENILLNGSILGMTRREIARKFDAIVAFSEIGEFLDTPVKRYSSGMYIRLAFAVASHLEPEVLIIDEVLAVGDAAFQRKCLAKIGEVSHGGRTVLFVSHNMAAIQNLCNRVAYLEHGRLRFIGGCREGIDLYTGDCGGPEGGQVDLSAHPGRRSGKVPVLREVRLLDRYGALTDQFPCGAPMRIELVIEGSPAAELNVSAGFEDPLGGRLFTVGTYMADLGPVAAGGRARVAGYLDEVPLAPGRYCLTLDAIPPREDPIDTIDQAIWFDVVPSDYYGNGWVPRPTRGTFLVRSRWEAPTPGHRRAPCTPRA
jgi:lipopolysaccharide transport system ATP-binding protein